MRVSLVSLTQPEIFHRENDERLTPEELIAYTARVSNPSNQMNNETSPRLLRYLIKHGHWSPFEMVDMTVEVETSRAIAAQILRHWSFSFQEFSQRYAAASGLGFERHRARRQDTKNRQNSIDDLPEETIEWFDQAQQMVEALASKLYQEALDRGIAKEQARFLLPLSTKTKIYMKASVRDWIHYFAARSTFFPNGKGAQREHSEVADEIYTAFFVPHFPTVCEALSGA